MPAIGLAAAIIERRDPDAVIGSFAADHVIRHEGAFREAVPEAAAVARNGRIVTIGIKPTFPLDGVRLHPSGARLSVEGAPQARAVAEFVEKPDERRPAATWQRAGSGGTQACSSPAHPSARHPRPRTTTTCRRAAGHRGRPGAADADWAGLEKIAIDHAIAEPAAADGPSRSSRPLLVGRRRRLRVARQPGGCGLHAGRRGHLHRRPRRRRQRRRVGGGRCARRPMVAVVGLDDVVVIDTPDALLVVARDRAQDVKVVVERLKASGREDLT